MRTGSLLYNYELAKTAIKESKTAILVESPANVWRLAEAGIENSVALFGINFSQEKQLILDSLGVTNLILLLDNDPPDKKGKRAGEEGARRIIKECSNYYNIRNIQLKDVKDVAELKSEEVRKIINV